MRRELILVLFTIVTIVPATTITVLATWPFTKAVDAAWEVLNTAVHWNASHVWGTALNAVVAGCTEAEADVDIHSVGYGNSPDEEGHTTLDAMVMDGKTMEAGAVAAMPDIREAAQVAREVLLSSKHTLLAGAKAAEFGKSRGFRSRSLDTPESIAQWKQWKQQNCQPNYRVPTAWEPDPQKNCGPYKPKYELTSPFLAKKERPSNAVNFRHHDTIGLVAIDHTGSMAVGLSTSGAIHKMPGRVGDTPIPGAGGYVDNEVGGAAGTGDGDVMMRFLLSYQAVQLMRTGMDPATACRKSLETVKQKGPWSGALVALSKHGQYGAACVGFGTFHFTVRNEASENASQVIPVTCFSN